MTEFSLSQTMMRERLEFTEVEGGTVPLYGATAPKRVKESHGTGGDRGRPQGVGFD